MHVTLKNRIHTLFAVRMECPERQQERVSAREWGVQPSAKRDAVALRPEVRASLHAKRLGEQLPALA